MVANTTKGFAYQYENFDRRENFGIRAWLNIKNSKQFFFEAWNFSILRKARNKKQIKCYFEKEYKHKLHSNKPKDLQSQINSLIDLSITSQAKILKEYEKIINKLDLENKQTLENQKFIESSLETIIKLIKNNNQKILNIDEVTSKEEI